MVRSLSYVSVLILLAVSARADTAVAVIAHPSVPVDALKKSELLNFYLFDIVKWPDQQPVVVLDLKPKGETRDAFYHFLGKRPSRMKSIWLRKVLSGEGDPPEAMPSEVDLVAKVASTRGAIGFAEVANVKGEVKVLIRIEPSRED
jgi:ABC-type phosphate transport system substrate-binding protein